jgi:two-component system sensor histidine kinase/response regulator
MKKILSFKCYSTTLLVFLSLLFSFSCFSQKKAIDSTLNVLKNHMKEDSLRANALIDLSYLYQTSNLVNSEYYAKEALGIVNRLNNEVLTCAALSQLGSVYNWERKTTEALTTYFHLQEIAQRTNQDNWLIKGYLGVSYAYELENEWGNALRYTLDALKVAEKSPDPFDEEDVYNHLGSDYIGLKNDKLAEDYLRKAAILFKKDNNLDQLGDCEIGLAKVFVMRRNYDSATHHFDNAVALFTSLDEPYQIADVYQQTGDMYVSRTMYKQAENYYKKTIAIYKKTYGSDGDYALAVLGLGTVALSEKKYDTASSIFHQEFAKVKQANIIETQLQCLLYMSKSDSALGNYKEALEHMQDYANLYDSFYSQAKTRTTQRMLIEFDMQRKEKENEQLKNENSLQQQHMAIFAVAGIALLIAGAFLALLYKQKTEAFRSVEQMQHKTEIQKNELTVINAVKDKLISMIAHDVRSPLTSLQNTLHLTRQKILNEEEFDRLSLILDNDIRHLVSMLDNTLLWAREQIHALKVTKIPFDLHSVAQDVIELYHQPIQDKNLSVQNNIPATTEVVSDKEIIHTALRNFISNAIKFTPSGTCIELNAEQKNGALLVTVKDEGVGISKEILNKINKKEFVSTRGTNNEKGTGLGLMFTRDLLLKLGEELHIETQTGKGTAITFSIHKQDEPAS